MSYPFELQRREAAAIRLRREKAAPFAFPSRGEGGAPPPEATSPGVDLDRLPPRTVGLALSGGGIRAATFSLGILQALAKKGRLRDIDFLSSVSAGSYTGCFLGRLFTRDSIASLAKTNNDPCARVESILHNAASPQIKWLRENASYPIRAGGSDGCLSLAVVWRDLLTIYLILALLGFALFGLLRMAGDQIARFVGVPGFMVACGSTTGNSFSSWWWLPLGVLGAAVFPCAIAYWIAPKQDTRASFSFFPAVGWIAILAMLGIVSGLTSGFYAALSAIVVLLLGAIWLEVARQQLPPNLDPSTGEISADPGTVIRNRLTRGLGEALVLLLVCILWAATDTIARGLSLGKFYSLITTWTLLVVAVTALLRRLAIFHHTSAAKMNGSGVRSSLFPSVGLIAFPTAGLLLILLDGTVHWLFNQHHAWGCAALLIGVVLTLIFGRAFDCLNYSAPQNAYGVRLSRTFLGASNPARLSTDASEEGRDIQLVHPDDDMPFEEYHPEDNGGPLHVISLCVNETIDAVSQRAVHQRKGLPMGVGPCGVSVGRKFHAIWAAPPPAIKRPWYILLRQFLDGCSTRPEGGKTALRAVLVPGEVFHVFLGATDWPACVESLSLSKWMATSGASFGTGSGRTKSRMIFLLLGLGNLRLGYWWDSGLNASDRPGHFPGNFWRRLKAQPAALFKMQSLLLADILGRFQGVTQRFWHISDGGYFDNTGIYELLRRHTPFIIAVDGSEDASFDFTDMAELVRQARIDFGARVEFVEPNDATTKLPAWILAWLPNPARTLGSLQEIGRPNQTHAALAHVTYGADREPSTWIVVLKASVTGDESLDIISYKKANPSFPGDPATERFFDQSQWESYRALGEHIGEIVLS